MLCDIIKLRYVLDNVDIMIPKPAKSSSSDPLKSTTIYKGHREDDERRMKTNTQHEQLGKLLIVHWNTSSSETGLEELDKATGNDFYNASQCYLVCQSGLPKVNSKIGFFRS